jgi:hypothetical protein
MTTSGVSLRCTAGPSSSQQRQSSFYNMVDLDRIEVEPLDTWVTTEPAVLAPDEPASPLFGDIQCHFEWLATFDMAKQFLVTQSLAGIRRHAIGMGSDRTDFIQKTPLHLQVIPAMNPFVE